MDVTDGLSILHVAPHPDDELIGAPATLMALRDAGHRVFNLACSLGSPSQRERRGLELEEAMRRARFEWKAIQPPVGISSGDDLRAAQRRLADEIGSLLQADRFDLIVSPTPHDGQHGHEVVGRATADAIASRPEGGPRWWMWGLWADLPLPTLFVPFDEDRLAEVLHALEAHRGEIDRSDYRAVVEGRARAARVLGVERVFGWGEPKPDGPFADLLNERRPYAELLMEVMHVDGDWWLGAPRTPDFCDPLRPVRPSLPIGWWIHQASVRDRVREARRVDVSDG
jgi:LmbE family N-acetylglucosaminyl deacetylase